MFRVRKSFIALSVLVLLATLAACGATPTSTVVVPTQTPVVVRETVVVPVEVTAVPTAGKEQKVKTIAAVLPGSVGDSGFNGLAYLGLQRLAAEGYKTAYTEMVPTPDNESQLRSYAQQGYDLIIGHGFTFADPALKVAPEFPNQYFFLSATKCPTGVTPSPNICFQDYKEFEAFYLLGMVAGGMTKSNKVGWIGGMECPIGFTSLAAYTLGAREVNPNVKVMAVFPGSFDDPVAGKEAALTMIANGADVLSHDADLTGIGVIFGAIEKGVYYLGANGDQSPYKPELCLTSMLNHIDLAIKMQPQRVEDGKFAGTWRPGLAEGIMDLAPFGPAVPQELRDLVLRRKQEISDGKFIVPEIHERIDLQ